jgi:hypothetical protein
MSGGPTSERPAGASWPLAPSAAGGLAVGVGLFTVLLAYQGVRDVGGALIAAGPGLLVVALFHLVPMLANAAEAVLFDRRAPGSRPWRRLDGSAIGQRLLPVLQVGGNVVKARWLAARGVPGAIAGASVVVDVMLMVSTQIVFTLIGTGLLVTLVGGQRVVVGALVGAGIIAALAASFYLAQRRGLFAGMVRGLRRMLGERAGDALASAVASTAPSGRLSHARTLVLAGVASAK